MKANFALSLSFEGIRLLHRAAGGWRLVGSAALDDPDLRGALTTLRKTALGLEPGGLRSKLIIPNSQIKYLTLDTPGADAKARREAAYAALDGQTPYKVDDLAFDVSPDGDTTHVAAVARETLAEAETFAAEHRFGPISCVAIPDEAPFLGEPFFGATEHAHSLLVLGDAVEPDWVAVVVIGDAAAPSGPVVEVEEATAAVSVPDPQPVAEEAPDGTFPPLPPAPKPLPKAEPDEISIPDTPVPGFSSRRSQKSPAAPALGGVTRRFVPGETTEAPPLAQPEVAPAPAIEEQSGADVLAASIPVDDEAAQEIAPDVAARLTHVPPTPESQRDAQFAAQQSQAARTLAARIPAGDIPPPKVPRPASERQRMTIFGARTSEEGGAAVIGGKPRYLGLALTAMLLVFLAGVAAWATVFRGDGIASFFNPPPPDVPALTEEFVPEVPEPDAVVETASLVVEPQIEEPPLAAPEPPAVFDPDAAEEHYAVTGIWTIPPETPDAPAVLSLDDLYVASIDPENPTFDAIALVAPEGIGTDREVAKQSDPAPAGTEFVLDARGLVVPTRTGALSPDGYTVFLGRPAAVPPPTPERRAIGAVEEPTPEAPDLELAAFRPRERPSNLVENTERQQFGGLTRTELAGFRPKSRPESAQQEQQTDAPPTAQAVAQSSRPESRPRNFERIVARIRANPDTRRAEEATPRRVAAVAPRTVAPAIPSVGSVTRQATIRNAINLNRINLMGVYGTPANRRALVRLSNGRYKKVKVGDRIDGGRVSAIGESELRYQKGNRNIVLKMPRT